MYVSEDGPMVPRNHPCPPLVVKGKDDDSIPNPPVLGE